MNKPTEPILHYLPTTKLGLYWACTICGIRLRLVTSSVPTTVTLEPVTDDAAKVTCPECITYLASDVAAYLYLATRGPADAS